MEETGHLKGQDGEVWPPPPDAPPVEAVRADDLPSPRWLVEEIACFFMSGFFMITVSVYAAPLFAVAILLIAVPVALRAKKRRTKRGAVSVILGVGMALVCYAAFPILS